MILKDYCAQETGEALRDVADKTVTLRRVQPAVTKPQPKPADDAERLVAKPRFLRNKAGLIPSWVYTQFCEWYDHAIIPKD